MAKASQKSLTFESALSELEGLVASMEAGQLTLEQSLASYKRGAELLHFCQKSLEGAQQQVHALTAANTLQNLSDAGDLSGAEDIG
ncbi:MAG TPA: exodeoxyribonuclease VII small subunit [Betaproteobacteria bacterium]|nr:exodeoxyribonuclease VII small subunit [Betaproteobacteria bacterium]